MPYFESDPQAIGWFEMALTHRSAHVRRDAIRLLGRVDLARRGEWLARAERDPDPSVVAAAVIEGALAWHDAWFDDDLFESDFAEGLDAPDLQWEWEYGVSVCDGVLPPSGSTLVWTRQEDDSAARRMALLKCYVGKESQLDNATPIIVSKRLVTRFTRSARSFSETVKWNQSGRPRYSDP